MAGAESSCGLVGCGWKALSTALIQPCLVLGLKMGKWLKTRYLTIFPCTWDFVILGIGAHSTHQCIPERFLKKMGRVLVNL